MQYLALACRLLIGVVFVVSAGTKLLGTGSFASFVRATRKMRVVPRGLATPVAVAVVVSEVAIAVLMAVPLPLAGAAGFLLATGLLAAFTVGIVVAVRSGDTEPCRCFGKSVTPMGWQHVGRNGFLILAALGGLAGSLTGGPLDLAIGVVAGLAGAVLGGLVTVFDDLYGLFRPTPAASSRR